MHRARVGGLLLVVLSLCSGGVAQVESRAGADELLALTQSELSREADALFPAVLDALGLPSDTVLDVRLSDADEIAEVLETEQVRAMRNADLPDAALQARAVAAMASKLLVAKYDTARELILVAPATLVSVAELLQQPELARLDVLRAVLLHEGVHAASQARYGWVALYETLPAGPRSSAFGALLEGHAQFVARRLAERLELREDFEAFTASIAAEPPGLEAGVRQLALLQTADLLAQYFEGESFVAALVEAEGEGVLERLYRDPPTEMGAVRRPEWYLDPASRPQATHDFAVPLDVLESALGEGWRAVRLTASPAQIDAALNLLPKPETARVLSGLLANRMLTATRSDAQGAVAVISALYEFVDAAAAQHYLDAAAALSKLKDEAFREGQLRILASSRRELERDGARGAVEHKTFEFGGNTGEVVSLVLARGQLALELVYTNEPIEEALLEKLGLSLLDELEATEASAADAGD